MHRRILRETTLTHLMTALGVVLLGIALATGPLGKSPLEGSPRPSVAGAVAQAGLQSYDGLSPNRDTALEEAVRSRGGRGGDHPAAEATPAASSPTATASPTATPQATATPTPSPTPLPAPTVAPGPKLRVGIQSGHWKANELPAELASLRTSTGAQGNGWRESDVNLDISRRVVALLEQQNLIVDLIPATVPSQYKADAFVAIHGDANSNTGISGYKLARATRSSIPAQDDALLRAVSGEYAAATGLPYHAGSITVNMTAYYAFANRGIDHSVAPTTPAVILEMGFLTTAGDLKLLTEQPDRVATGIAKGILRFLGRS